MSREADLIARLRRIARDPAARGLADDAAVLPVATGAIVLTHDMIVEGVHYLPDDPPEDVAWKLLAVNLSDLAAKGARPLGILLGYPLGDPSWDARFMDGLEAALCRFDVALLGGDTVSSNGAGRMLGLTALGEAPPCGAPARSGARSGDVLYLTGTIGAAGLGLEVASGRREGPADALKAYRCPTPRLGEGRALAPRVHAMMDVSDGLLVDAARMARASGVAFAIDLDAVPLASYLPRDRAGRIAAATAGDDYELLFAAAPGMPPIVAGTPVTAIGMVAAGAGLSLHDRDGPVPLPARLGYEHDG